MAVVVVNKPPAKEPKHLCDLPGFRERKRKAIRLFSVVRCQECGTKYQRVRGAFELGAHWEPVR
jgi:hypothetical protein